MAEQQLEELISSLKNQGILNDYIAVRSLQDEKDPRFLENLIPDFFTSAEKKIAKFLKQSIIYINDWRNFNFRSEADVNYSSMAHLAYEIKEEAS